MSPSRKLRQNRRPFGKSILLFVAGTLCNRLPIPSHTAHGFSFLSPILLGLPGRLSSFDLRELRDFMAMEAGELFKNAHSLKSKTHLILKRAEQSDHANSVLKQIV